MKPSVCIDFHLFLLAEGRHDLITARPSIRTLALATALWDLADAGILWGVPGKSFRVVSQLPSDLAPLKPVYDFIEQTARPSSLYRSFYADNMASARALSEDIIRFLATYRNIDEHTWVVPEMVYDILIQRIRKAALGDIPNVTDQALLLSLNRATFLKEKYFHGRSEHLHLRNRLKDLAKTPPRAAGWSMQKLMSSFFLFDEWPIG